jgi:K+-transporting ATPase c subunit
MLKYLAIALRFTLVTGIAFGLIYPLVVTGVARAFFAGPAD